MVTVIEGVTKTSNAPMGSILFGSAMCVVFGYGHFVTLRDTVTLTILRFSFHPTTRAAAKGTPDVGGAGTTAPESR